MLLDIQMLAHSDSEDITYLMYKLVQGKPVQAYADLVNQVTDLRIKEALVNANKQQHSGNTKTKYHPRFSLQEIIS